jgi:hypothetical protein
MPWVLGMRPSCPEGRRFWVTLIGKYAPFLAWISSDKVALKVFVLWRGVEGMENCTSRTVSRSRLPRNTRKLCSAISAHMYRPNEKTPNTY